MVYISEIASPELITLEFSRAKTMTHERAPCQFDGCTRLSVATCFHYAVCGKSGCQRKFCIAHGAPSDVNIEHGRKRDSTPCADCLPKAKKAYLLFKLSLAGLFTLLILVALTVLLLKTRLRKNALSQLPSQL